MKKPRCYNCKFASKGFKISNVTHHSCLEKEQAKRIENGHHPFEALRSFGDTCENHEFKQRIELLNK